MTTAAAYLTDQLLASPRTCVTETDRHRVRDQLLTGIPPLVGAIPTEELLVVTLSLLRRMGGPTDWTAPPDRPFSWQPAYARRSLGLAAIDACLRQGRRAPAEVVQAVAESAVAAWGRTGWRTYHWEPWYAGLAAGGRAAVVAEAVTWATALWSALDWGRLGPVASVGGADDLWVCATAPRVRLKGRAELRVDLRSTPSSSGTPAAATTALVAVSPGLPAASARTSLSFLALAASLRAPSRPVPARVVGLWPEGGAAHIVEIDAAALDAAAAQVLGAVRAWATDASATRYPDGAGLGTRG